MCTFYFRIKTRPLKNQNVDFKLFAKFHFQSKEEPLNRVLLVLATLVKEINSLKSEAESKFYDALLFYGEGIPAATSTAASGVDNQMAIAKIMPLLQVRFFVYFSRIEKKLLSWLISNRDPLQAFNHTHVPPSCHRTWRVSSLVAIKSLKTSSVSWLVCTNRNRKAEINSTCSIQRTCISNQFWTRWESC